MPCRGLIAPALATRTGRNDEVEMRSKVGIGNRERETKNVLNLEM